MAAASPTQGLGVSEAKGVGTGQPRLPHGSGDPQGDPSGAAIFNVRDYGATGKRAEDAGPAIQKAIDACAAAGGGVVYLPPGEYTSGTLHLRSHVRFHIEGGATLFASKDPQAYDVKESNDSAALFYGIDLENISIEGRGTVDGQHEFIWMPQPEDFERAYGHLLMMKNLGKSLMRSFPVGFPQRQVYPHLVWLYHCKDVQISGLSFVRSPSWTYLSEGVRPGGGGGSLYVHQPEGCRLVRWH